MARIERADVGILSAAGAFLQAFVEGRRQQEYLNLQEYNTYQAPAERERWERERIDLEGRMRREAADYEQESVKRLALWKQQTIAPMETAQTVEEKRLLGEQGLGFLEREEGIKAGAYRGATPDVAKREEALTRARLAPYMEQGLTPKGGKATRANPLAGINTEQFLKLYNNANDWVESMAKAEVEATAGRDPFGKTLPISQEQIGSLIYFNPERRGRAFNDAMLGQLRSFLSESQYKTVQEDLARGGGGLLDLYMRTQGEVQKPLGPELPAGYQKPPDEWSDEELLDLAKRRGLAP